MYTLDTLVSVFAKLGIYCCLLIISLSLKNALVFAFTVILLLILVLDLPDSEALKEILVKEEISSQESKSENNQSEVRTLIEKQREFKSMTNHCQRSYYQLDLEFREEYNRLEREIKQENKQYLKYIRMCYENSNMLEEYTKFERLFISKSTQDHDAMREFLILLTSVNYNAYQKVVKERDLLLLQNNTSIKEEPK